MLCFKHILLSLTLIKSQSHDVFVILHCTQFRFYTVFSRLLYTCTKNFKLSLTYWGSQHTIIRRRPEVMFPWQRTTTEMCGRGLFPWRVGSLYFTDVALGETMLYCVCILLFQICTKESHTLGGLEAWKWGGHQHSTSKRGEHLNHAVGLGRLEMEAIPAGTRDFRGSNGTCSLCLQSNVSV